MIHDIIYRRAFRRHYENVIADAKYVIGEALKIFGYPAAVSISGGKDSVAMAHLVSLYCRPILVWNDSGLEMPESREVVRRTALMLGLRLEIAKGNALEQELQGGCTDDDCIKKPVREALARVGARVDFVGLRADESHRRKMVINKYGPIFFSKTWRCGKAWPMRKWKAEDSLAYLDDYSLPVHPAYCDSVWGKRENVRTSWAFDADRIPCGESEIVRRKYPELFRKLREAGRC
jgi:3'-phosphoadenosine 5'-phosphosulfate sulfotransferase (PAPS reductase)/FAD synthetase